jgi:hypothetical protein
LSNTGNYLISYSINLSAAVLVSSRIQIAGTTNALIFDPTLSVSSLSAEGIINISTANTTIILQLFSIIGASVTLQSGQGAELTIIMLS